MRSKSANKIYRLLSVVLSEESSATEKKDILEKEFHITMTQPVDGRVIAMCNLSEAIEEKGSLKALISIVRNMMDRDIEIDVIADLVGKEVLMIQKIHRLIAENQIADENELARMYMEQEEYVL